ncbi:MAG TPA: cupin domain-containing protein [Pyrinomonadaceae bacterium]|nr:cupin domain-containing protein [Pyrinomonadaceae bacterium]
MSTSNPATPAQENQTKTPTADDYRPRNLTLEQVRSFGSIGNLNDGIEITTQGVPTRLLAWPGIGYPNQGLHLLTLKPGTQSKFYTYGVSEEALFCIRGKGKVFIHNKWVEIQPGDIAYYPEGVGHAYANPESNTEDFVLVAQITPPQVQLYEDGGYWDQSKREFNFDLIDRAKKDATWGSLSTEMQLQYNDSHPELRSWNLTNEQIRSHGALFNIFVGADFTGIGVPMKLVLFPGFGTRLAGLHIGYVSGDAGSDVHYHPVSEDLVITHQGTGWVYIDGQSVEIGPLDIDMASVQAKHGGVPPPTDSGGNTVTTGQANGGESGGSQTSAHSITTGFGAPAQQELYMSTPYFQNGMYVRPLSTKLDITDSDGSA